MLSFRKTTLNDEILYYEWRNDIDVRTQSYNSNPINLEIHRRWFRHKLKDSSCLMLVFQNEYNLNIGQVRIQKEDLKEASIGISVSREHRGKSYAKEMIQLATDHFLNSNKGFIINAYIKKQNLSSKFAFEKAGFEFQAEILYENVLSLHYTK